MLSLKTSVFVSASNHEEMIKIKDDYKRENELLRSENERLAEENKDMSSRVASDKASALKVLQMTLAKLQTDLHSAQENKTLVRGSTSYNLLFNHCREISFLRFVGVCENE